MHHEVDVLLRLVCVMRLPRRRNPWSQRLSLPALSCVAPTSSRNSMNALSLDLSAACDISNFFNSHRGVAANRSSLSLSSSRKSLASVPLLVSSHLTGTLLDTPKALYPFLPREPFLSDQPPFNPSHALSSPIPPRSPCVRRSPLPAPGTFILGLPLLSSGILLQLRAPILQLGSLRLALIPTFLRFFSSSSFIRFQKLSAVHRVRLSYATLERGSASCAAQRCVCMLQLSTFLFLR